MSVRIRVYDRKVKAALIDATADGIKRATVFLHGRTRQTVGVPNTGVRVPVQRRTPGGNRSSRTIYPSPSKPGEPPRKRTGWGQRHIVWEFDPQAIAGRVGIAKAALYMLYLELGTRHVARRPWLVATLKRNLKMIALLATSGGRRSNK